MYDLLTKQECIQNWTNKHATVSLLLLDSQCRGSQNLTPPVQHFSYPVDESVSISGGNPQPPPWPPDKSNPVFYILISCLPVVRNTKDLLQVCEWCKVLTAILNFPSCALYSLCVMHLSQSHQSQLPWHLRPISGSNAYCVLSILYAYFMSS